MLTSAHYPDLLFFVCMNHKYAIVATDHPEPLQDARVSKQISNNLLIDSIIPPKSTDRILPIMNNDEHALRALAGDLLRRIFFV